MRTGIGLLLLLFLVIRLAARSQMLAENFESGLPASAPTTPTAYPLSSGEWTLYYAYQGSNSTYICSDGGTLDLRVQKTSIAPGGGYAITPLLNNGVGSVSFKEGRGSRTITIQKSTDNGTTWTTIGTPISTQCVLIVVAVNDAAANRIKIWNASTSDEDIDNVTITNTGSVPGLVVSPSSLEFGNVIVNTISAEQTYLLSGYDLNPSSGNITAFAPTAFEISTTSGSGFGSTVQVPYSGGVLNGTTIYVRFSPSSLISYSGSVSNAGGAAAVQNVAVTGSGVQQSEGSGIYVSPTGNDSNPGTILLPVRTLARAVSMAGPDSLIYMRGGTYAQNSTQSVSRSGTDGHLLKIWAYPGERPVLDFATQTSGDGISLSGSYCYLRGIEATNAYHNGINVSGHFNVIENCSVYDNRNSGFQMGSSGTANPRGNLILNCDSYRNYDAPIGGNADGYAVKWNIGSGNVFKGCRSWNNSDDGWDLWMADSSVVIDSCFAFRNGVDIWHSGSFNGNGNGFKLGGNSIATPHRVWNCVAFDNSGNTGRGFDENNNLAGQTLYNCTSYRNQGDNFHFANSVTVGQHIIRNCISYLGVVNITSGMRENNSWQGFTVTNADFESLDTSVVTIARNPDGSMPRIPFARLAAGSSLIDAGLYVGLPYVGAAPDLGAFEYDSVGTAVAAVSVSPVTLSFGNTIVNSSVLDTVKVKSVGFLTLHLDSIRVRAGEFAATPTASAGLPVGDSLLVRVTFSPTSEGAQSGYLVVYSDATTSPDSVHLTGSGVRAAFSGSPNPLAFGNVSVGGSASDTITVTNTGTATLIIDSVRVSAGQYAATPSGSSTIGAGQSAKFAVVFSPTSVGVQNGSVVFHDNAPSSPHSISASGTGVNSTLNVSFSLSAGWDMASLPVLNPVSGNAPLQVFPTGIAEGYVWDWSGSNYVQVTSLLNMRGYWDKFTNTTSHQESVTGTRDIANSLGVGTGGWRMVGTLTDAIPTSAVTSDPAGLLNGAIWWGWSGSSYQQTTTLSPGHGYWVKVAATTNGTLYFTNPTPSRASKTEATGVDLTEKLNSITITDSRGGSQTLYFGADAKKEITVERHAMPPLPPVGAFDARFETSEGGSLVQTHAVEVKDAVEFPVKVQSDAYPLTVSWTVNKGTASYELTDGLGGRVFRAKEMGSGGSMQIINSGLSKFTIRLVGDGMLPKEFALEQNYPNPFNPITTIKYDLPVDSRVSLVVFNILGQEVVMLANGEQKAGYRSVEWNASNVASGVYFYRLEACNFTSVKKLLLLR